MNTFPVNEYFVTVQGEAQFTGTPCLFIRLQFCDVGCAWCDTKHTWEVQESKRVTSIVDKWSEDDTYQMMTTEEILSLAKSKNLRHIVLTGGEPCAYDLIELTTRLIEENFTVQVETSGTYEIKVHPQTWVTVSPKENMAGGRQVLESAISRANEIKYPVGKQRDIDAAHKYTESKVVWLQPLSQSQKATSLCVDACTSQGYKLSLQTHKFIGVR